VAALVKAPAGRAGRPSKSLTLEQPQELLRAAGGSRLYACVVLRDDRLRTEELRALRWNEAELDVGTVAVCRAVRATPDTKTPKSRRFLSLPRLAVRALREYRDRQAEDRLLAGVLWEDHGLAFASAVGTPLDRHNVLREFRKITQAAGLGDGWVPREMLHTFVSLLSSNGKALEDIATWSGTGHGCDCDCDCDRYGLPEGDPARTATRCRGHGPAIHLTTASLSMPVTDAPTRLPRGLFEYRAIPLSGWMMAGAAGCAA
jgi:integrase